MLSNNSTLAHIPVSILPLFSKTFSVVTQHLHCIIIEFSLEMIWI